MKQGKKKKSTTQIAFEAGDFERAINLDSTDSSERLFRMGSYSFLGRMIEARALYDQIAESLSDLEQTKGTFYLAVSYIRHLDYQNAVACLVKNLARSRALRTGIITGYAHMGMGIFRYCYGRLRPARRHAERAYHAAIQSNDPFLLFLATDLLGHCEINLGQVQQGLARHSVALGYARDLGRGAMEQTSLATTLLYQSNLGLIVQPAQALSSIRKQLVFKDSFMAAQIELEMARVQMIEGNMEAAHTLLKQSTKECFSLGNRRLRALHYIRRAQWLYLVEERAESGAIVERCLSELRNGKASSPDLRLETVLLGLAEKLETASQDRNKLISLTRKQGQSIASRILSREIGLELSQRPLMAEDPLGDMIDGLTRQSPRAIQECIRTRRFGLLHKAFEFPLGKMVFLFDLEWMSITIIVKGQVVHYPKLTPLQRRLLLCLVSGPATLANLAKQVWNEPFDKGRHEKLVTSLLSRLRITTPFLYRAIGRNTDKFRIIHDSVAVFSQKEVEGKVKAENPDAISGLNFRQNVLLQRKHPAATLPFFDVDAYSKFFGISDRTAQRDLSLLVSAGGLRSVGRGRATRYCLNKKTSLVERVK